MRVHCKKVVDKRFPERFLDQFVTNVEEAKWSIYDDPHGEVPKKIMADMIKSLKAFYDVPQCEEVPKEEEIMDVDVPQCEEVPKEEEIMYVEELTPEQIEENIDMDVEELTPEQQIERNIEKMKKNFDKSAKSRFLKRAAVNAKAKNARAARKDENQQKQAENMAKNCLKKKKDQEE